MVATSFTLGRCVALAVLVTAIGSEARAQSDPPAAASLLYAARNAISAHDLKAAKQAITACIEDADADSETLASCYVELGLVAKAEHDRSAEAIAYIASLAQHADPDVAAALKKLGKKWSQEESDDAPPICDGPRAREDICACLVANSRSFFDSSSYSAERRRCTPLRKTASFVLFRVANHRDEAYYLLSGDAKGWSTVTELEQFVSRNFRWTQFHLLTMEERTLAGARVVDVRYTEDTELPFDGEAEHSTSETVCAVRSARSKCVGPAMLRCEYRVAPSDETDENKAIVPGHWSSEARLEILPEGIVSTTIVHQSEHKTHCKLSTVHDSLW